jgi:hypothetical protein
MTWEDAILGALRRQRGDSSLAEIYAVVAESAVVTPYHKEPWKPGGQPRYQCAIRRRLTTLVETGVVRRTGQGRYRIAN